MIRRPNNKTIVVSVHGARANFGRLRDYVRLAAPEPEALTIIGQESIANGTHRLTSGQIKKIIKASRAQKSKRG